MYEFFLSLHNLLRWVIVILAVLALVRAYRGWLGKRPWTPTDRKTGTFFGIAMDIQLLLGLVLYFVYSPFTLTTFSDMSAYMGITEYRFYAIEHILMMVLAVVAVHLGSVFARRAAEDSVKHRQAAIFYSLAVLLVLVAIPWARPIFRLPF